MSEPDYSGVTDENIPHEGAAAAATDAQMRRTSNDPAIADVTETAIADAASPGASYVQAEVVALRTQLVALNARLAANVAATNDILSVLREAELIPES